MPIENKADHEIARRELADEIERLREENARLRDLVFRAYSEGYDDAWIDHQLKGAVHAHRERWKMSEAKAALAQRGEEEGDG